ncbi:hypothetical protein FNV43_RR01908 [Rhamnella rubrinervis]|uniref:ADP-ribosyl cyclase/cyclic ADP-ribose hydrolase n=1 Tax=Rhamnella rubrinervis TaxID=2594499 RepID=A0A8K0MSH0_9ROSA|nr:hypothetical protein FNV43_RR01908 [Rhamnella rubrinervis]
MTIEMKCKANKIDMVFYLGFRRLKAEEQRAAEEERRGGERVYHVLYIYDWKTEDQMVVEEEDNNGGNGYFSLRLFSTYCVYASSRWCLDELVRILQCMKDLNKIVLPIFYHVDPSDERKQIGSVGEAFQRHEHVFSHNLQKVKTWRAAFSEVGNLAGYHLQDG